MTNPAVNTLLASQVALDRAQVNRLGAGANGVGALSASREAITTVLTLTALSIALVDNAGVVAHGGKKIMDFPAGYIAIESVVADLAVTKSSAGVDAAWDGDFSLGSVIADTDASLTSTEADIIASTATPQAVAGVTTAIGSKLTATNLDGTTTPVDMYLNVIVDDADHNVTGTACNLLFTGTITVTWRNMG